MKRIILTVCILILAGGMFQTHAQQDNAVDDLIEKINLKLRKDKSYLNLHQMIWSPDNEVDPQLKTIPRSERRDPYSLKFGNDILYRIVFLKDGLEMDSLVLLYIDEIKLSAVEGENLFAGVSESVNDTTRVIDFRDMYNLETSYPDYYAKLYEIVEIELEQNPDLPPQTILGINPDDEIQTSMGISARDNSDYLNFARINATGWYPEQKEQGAFRGRGSQESDFAFKIDASFSHLSFAHSFMEFSVGGASLIYDFIEPVMNLAPYQSMSVRGGFRTLFALTDKPDLNSSTYLDAKFMARLPVGTTFIDLMPALITDDPIVNFSTGVIIDLSMTRPFDLPFINIYAAIGDGSFTSPEVIVKENGENIAYWSHTQLAATMSFYWNTSDTKTSRFRIDIGGAYYDLYRARYSVGENYRSDKKLEGALQPFIQLHYNFVPDGPLLGGSFKLYDGQLTAKYWLKLAEFGPKHTLRFETIYVTPPILRSQRDWEVDGGLMMQLRYRYGL